MSAIETILTKLQRYPELKYERTANSITVASAFPDGFPVSLHEHGASFVVTFGGWHEQFDSESEAVECFGFGFSDLCRLRVSVRGGIEYRWTLQRLVDGTWCNLSETGLLFLSILVSPQRAFLQEPNRPRQPHHSCDRALTAHRTVLLS